MKRWAKEWTTERANASKFSSGLAAKMESKQRGQITVTSRMHYIHTETSRIHYIHTEREAQRAEEQTKREAEK